VKTNIKFYHYHYHYHYHYQQRVVKYSQVCKKVFRRPELSKEPIRYMKLRQRIQADSECLNAQKLKFFHRYMNLSTERHFNKWAREDAILHLI